MKHSILLLLVLFCSASLTGQPKEQKKYTFLLTGASFASPSNGWFELGCEALGAGALNRAIGGEAIANTANRMVDGTLYSPEELEEIDALVIMQVHDKDVFDETQLKEKYTDYQTPFDRTNYAAAYDYVIKRYITECYNLQFNEHSEYYGKKGGKPAVILLCTHWHDGRPLYNTSIRKLAQKWGFPLVEFDKYIGFSKEVPHPVTGSQTSLIYSQDQQEIHGVPFGWHPQGGKDKYIQQRMAAIFTDVVKKIFLFEE
ncbi:DUF5040 domain-containing protein [Parabacteroides pacaensis]|uniref:DUF5040 domain-containing protein n=1 Tax=Parabacteroides pacaensis TaxID=2086575 RepID=UPI000D0F6961|nr:DUF5040 domain-containing protein [Parabacteroides pacaensis]